MELAKSIEAIRSFNRFYTNIIGVIDRHILGSPFSLTEVRILSEVYHEPGCTARSIKATLNVDEGYLSRTISKLHELGLVDREQHNKDGRIYKLTLSKKGRVTFEGLNKKAAAAIESLVGSLSVREVAEVVSSMERIEALLRKGEQTG